MKRWWGAIAVIAIMAHAAVVAQLAKDAAIARTEAILDHFQKGNTAEIVKVFDAKLTAALPEEKVKPVWPGIVAQFGPFKSVTERREGRLQDRQAVELVLAFEKDTIVMRAVFDRDGKVSGLVFRPLSGALLPPGSDLSFPGQKPEAQQQSSLSKQRVSTYALEIGKREI
jgi:Protein of unknown function (DUF3887)